MKLLPLLLAIPFSIPLAFARPVIAQNNCTWVIQGQLDESDPRLRGSNAPYEIHRFRATRGEEIFVEAESDYFNSQIALFKVEGNSFTLIDSESTGTDWQLFTAWIYEDGEYAIRVASVKYEYPFGQEPDKKFGYYTLQISPFECS